MIVRRPTDPDLSVMAPDPVSALRPISLIAFALFLAIILLSIGLINYPPTVIERGPLIKSTMETVL